MIGLRSRTYSPSSVTSRRSTPCVAGWCGPMLSVKSSVSGWTSVPESGTSGWSRRSITIERSRSRYGTLSGSGVLVIPARLLVLVEGEDHGLAALWEVAPLGVALVVLGHEDPAHVGMAAEHDAEHVEHLALGEVRAGPQVGDRGHARVVHAHARLHPDALHPPHAEQLVVHAQTRLLGQVVAAVQAREE